MNFVPVIPIAIYLFSAFTVPVVNAIDRRLRNPYALLMSFIALVMTVGIYTEIPASGPLMYWFGDWVPSSTVYGIALAVDSLSLLFAVLLAFFGFLAVLYSIGYMEGTDKRLAKYYVLLFLICAGSMGIMLTGDLFNLFVFLEILSFSAIAMVAFDGTDRAISAAINYLVLTTIGMTFVLVGIMLLYGVTGTLNIAHIGYKIQTAGVFNPDSIMGIVPLASLVLLLVGIGIKTSMIPLHTWMPEAFSSAPAPISMLFIGMKYGTGLYVILRLLSVLYGIGGFSLLITVIGVCTMLLGVIMAMMQSDLKSMLSYHAISQLGYMILAAGLGSTLGLVGCLFHVFNHVLYKGMLFLTAGSVQKKTGTLDSEKMGGLARTMPLTALAFAIGALAISGIPPLNGFASKWIIYNASFAVNPLLTAIGLLVSVLTLASFTKMFHAIFLGKGRPESEAVMKAGGSEAPWTMLAPMLILASLCVFFGIFPNIAIDYIVSPAVAALQSPRNYIEVVVTQIGAQPLGPLHEWATSQGVSFGAGLGNQEILTQVGYWNALLIGTLLLVLILPIYFLATRGEKKERAPEFLCGEDVEYGTPGHGFFYGFERSALPIFNFLRRMHSEIVNEYVAYVLLFSLFATLLFVAAYIFRWGMV